MRESGEGAGSERDKREGRREDDRGERERARERQTDRQTETHGESEREGPKQQRMKETRVEGAVGWERQTHRERMEGDFCLCQDSPGN